MLIALFIVGVLTVLGGPSIQSFFSRTQDQVLRQQLLRVIDYAEAEARARHASVMVCHSRNGVDCEGEWEDGQLVYMEESHWPLLFMPTKEPRRGHLHWRAFPGSHEALQFQSSGLMLSDNASFWYCPSSSIKPVWAIMLSLSGRSRVVLPDSQGEIRGSNGELIKC